jgi:hypothetical protein
MSSYSGPTPPPLLRYHGQLWLATFCFSYCTLLPSVLIGSVLLMQLTGEGGGRRTQISQKYVQFSKTKNAGFSVKFLESGV